MMQGDVCTGFNSRPVSNPSAFAGHLGEAIVDICLFLAVVHTPIRKKSFQLLVQHL